MLTKWNFSQININKEIGYFVGSSLSLSPSLDLFSSSFLFITLFILLCSSSTDIYRCSFISGTFPRMFSRYFFLILCFFVHLMVYGAGRLFVCYYVMYVCQRYRNHSILCSKRNSFMSFFLGIHCNKSGFEMWNPKYTHIQQRKMIKFIANNLL